MSFARVLLCLALIWAFIGTVFLIIALGTNNWTEISVNRNRINQSTELYKTGTDLPDIYYSRSYGFFRECFMGMGTPMRIPGTDGIPDRVPYMDPMDYKCIDIFPGFHYTPDLNYDGRHYVDVKIAYISLYAIGVFCAIVGIVIKCIGIARKKAIPVLITGFLYFLACLFITSAIALWHKSEEILMTASSIVNNGENIYNPTKRPPDVNMASSQTLGWTYILAWVGVGFLLLSALSSCTLTYLVVSEQSRKKKKTAQLIRTAEMSSKAYSALTGYTAGSTYGEFYPGEGGSTLAIVPYYGYSAGSASYPQYYSYDDGYGFMGYYNPYASI